MTGRPFSLVVTDSGLGGLAICAGLAHRLSLEPPGCAVVMTFFNALPETGRGYNRIPDLAGRVRTFDRALTGMEAFHPDLILVACNTLSTLYGRTRFHRDGRVPVVDIVGFGLDLILEHWQRRPDSRILLLGTRTTIETGVHAAGLMARGVPCDRIIGQVCDGLATLIEQGPERPAVQEQIDRDLDQVVAGCPDRSCPLLAVLCCTHYAYSFQAFRRSLTARFTGPVTLLDPNRTMVEGLPMDLGAAHDTGPGLDFRVVSRVLLSDQTVKAISTALEPVSPLVAHALRHYRHDPALFSL